MDFREATFSSVTQGVNGESTCEKKAGYWNQRSRSMLFNEKDFWNSMHFGKIPNESEAGHRYWAKKKKAQKAHLMYEEIEEQLKKENVRLVG